MNEPGAAADLAGRALAVAVRLLPGHRRDWGQAMRAELAAVDGARARRRYALGCVRAVLSDATALRTVAIHVIALTFGAIALALAISIRSSGARIETIAFVLALGLVAWSGRRSGPLGPVAEQRLARRIRGGGYAVLGAYVMLALAAASVGPHDDPRGVWVFYLALTLYLAAVLFATAHGTGLHRRTLRLAAALAVGGLTAWWVPMLLLAGVRADPRWALLSVTTTVLLGLAAGIALRRPRREVALAAAAAGVATCLLIFLAAQGTYALLPRLVPDLGFVAGMTPGARVETNRAEAIDPYVAELVLGALLGALLIGAGTATRSADTRATRGSAGRGAGPAAETAS